VWKKRVEENHPDTKNVRVIYTTPPYHDYHWLLHPDAVRRFGGEPFVRRVQNAFLKLNPNNPRHADILDLFGAKRFIRTDPKNYANIERIGREAGLIATNRRAGRRAVR
jgi:phosphonate transport system substrate-binding protein